MVRKMAFIGTSFFLGLFFASFFSYRQNFILSITLLIISILYVIVINRKNLTVSVCILAFSASFFNYGFYQLNIYEPIIALNGNNVEFSGVIEEMGYSGNDSASYTLRGKINGKTDAKILYYGDYIDCDYYDKIKIKGTVSLFSDTYLFPSESYYKAKGIYLEISADDLEITQNSSFNPIKSILHYRDYLLKLINKYLPSDEGDALNAMLFGDKTGLDNTTKTLMFRAGIGHIMSVSGAHLSVTAFMIMWLLKKFSRSKRLNFIIVECAVWSFVIFAGMSVSVLRSAIMITLIFSAELFKRKSDMFNSLGLAVIILSVGNPFIIRDVSFVLSVTGVFGMGVVAPYLTENIKFSGHFSKLRKNMLIMLAAVIPILPVSVFFFDEVSVISPITNVFLVPICSLALICGIIIAITGGIEIIAAPLLIVAGICCKIVIAACEFIGKLRFTFFCAGYRYIVIFMAAAIAVTVTAYFIFKDKKILIKTVGILSAIFILLNSINEISDKKYVHIAVIGDKSTSALIVYKNDSACVISLDNPQKNVKYVNKYLSRLGIYNVNVLAFTSKEEPGISAYNSRLQLFDVENILIPKEAYLLENTSILGNIPQKTDFTDTSIDM
ncbi:MAG TPA: ComEC/Rec2 family competence protein, partial [Oscillospiraceae bacterium]|nr:ComEC/Rec2 family competence protein [Oscillospiraceae bacterium]